MSNLLIKIGWSFYLAGCLTLPLLIIRFGGVTLSDMFFAVAFLVSFIGCIAKDGVERFYGIPPILFASMGYMGAGFISSLNLEADDLVDSVVTTIKFFYLTVIWFGLGAILINTFDKSISAAYAWTWGCAISSIGGVAQTLIDPFIIPGTEAVWGRAVGFTGHPNDLGASLGIALVPSIAIAIGGTLSRSARLLTILCLLLIVSGLVLSASASSIISASVSLAAWIFLTKRFRLGLTLGILVVCLAVVLGVFLESENIDLSAVSDLYNISEGVKAGTFNERIATYGAAWSSISDSPFIGVGTTAGGWITSAGLATHNVLLGAWYETGVFGAVAILILIFSIVLTSRRVLAICNHGSERDFVASLIGAEIAFFIYSMTAPGLYQRYGWISVALVLAIYNIKIKNRISSGYYEEKY